MRIALVTPVPPGSNRGNDITAQRWERIFRDLGHNVEFGESVDWDRVADIDCLVALHARRSAETVAEFHRRSRDKPIIVCLTGTDLHRDLAATAEQQQESPDVAEAFHQARQSLQLATRLVLLEPEGQQLLDPEFRDKCVVIYQSALPLDPRPQPVSDIMEFSLLAHLRGVKDPFRAEEATRLLPADSRIRVVHAGAALTPRMETEACRRSDDNPRYNWVGPVSHHEALEILCRSRATIISSFMEGAPSVVSEALVNGVPLLATRITSTIGLLGSEYPGMFAVGDTHALADLMLQLERDPAFARQLNAHLDPRRHLFDPHQEKQSWNGLLECIEHGHRFHGRHG